jgi:hypothetical protein
MVGRIKAALERDMLLLHSKDKTTALNKLKEKIEGLDRVLHLPSKDKAALLEFAEELVNGQQKPSQEK